MSAVILINPKYDHNVGAALRACSCWGVPTLRWTGHRVVFDGRRDRIPREERMKGYRDVDWGRTDRPLDGLAAPGRPAPVPVIVEVRQNSECLTTFEHPEEAVYIFGPEDGSVPRPYLVLGHRFVFIPTHHCLNLSAAVNVVLAHRRFSRQLAGLEEVATLADVLHEPRGGCAPTLDAIGWDGR
jgi:tRNA(Leu) C34 or U34 (ribose-2'-O)-methylase TrmL